MNAEIKDYVQKCETCSSYGQKQQKETLQHHDVPSQPLRKVGADIFQLYNKMYLVTVDYYSGYWEIDFLENTKASTVVKKDESTIFNAWHTPHPNNIQWTTVHYRYLQKFCQELGV